MSTLPVRPRAVLLLVAVIVLAVLAKTYAAFNYYTEQQTRFMMDTYVSISATGRHDVVPAAVIAALDRVQQIAVKFSAQDPGSPVYAFNHEGRPLADPEIVALVSRGLQISQASGGAFDMTVEPLAELWGFYTKEPHLPLEKDIHSALQPVGFRHLGLKNGILTRDRPDVRIDLGGIAKGYALVEAVKVLRTFGVTSAMVDAGGDVYVMGRKGLRLWNIGIRQPRTEGIVGYVSVGDTAVMGAGDYERFFIKDGRRYHHIFNPSTGYPTEGVASVTLICDDPVAGQAWGKIPFVLGPQKGLEMLSRIPGMDVIIILSSGERLYSKMMRHPLKVEPSQR